ncbi:WhiB family transcriptional regulator [Spirillospora sp. CA-142024]|uniref:WhiB family transcriptional regulator n=1 Tax=Spirillospora sp. CA-142024 TaxID=3240036 RepID=UPI003D8DF386
MRDHDRRRIPLADLIDECLSGAECLFDPDLHEGPEGTIELPAERDARETVAKEVCASCPALDDCRIYTARTAPKSGIWAAMTPTERTSRFEVSDGSPLDGRAVA